MVFLRIIGHPSVLVSLFIEREINTIICTERSEARRVATLHTDVSRVPLSATWRVACSHALSASSTSQTRPGARAHGTTASFPQEPGSFPLDMHSPFLLGRSLLKVPCSQRMSQGASTGIRGGHRLQSSRQPWAKRPEKPVLATWYICSQKTTSFSDGCTK